MKEYSFEYTDQKFLIILVGIFLIMLTGPILFLGSFIPVAGGWLGIGIAIGAPFLVFALNKRKLNKQVTAYLYDTSVQLDFGDYSQQIDFNSLKSYQIEDYNGITLRLKLSNNKKIELTASSGFSGFLPMKIFCQALEQKIILSNRNNFSHVTRITSAFENKWILVLMITLTAIFVIGIINSSFKDKLFTPSLYTSLAIFVGMWFTYFRARQKKRRQELNASES
ncbi:hypothetical protein [Dyadobacter frigoris]|uniref:Uncharacterized protein n=1 Tax=Dyadobacter frigoris TaxID=2576211 RepID=A0A4U6D9M1_9BACT|nr:hypothetical protein [Dyadobacter frigoris]TKT93506.1 hypothetical protein FDK13_06575 [Dyadobacter frigoris]